MRANLLDSPRRLAALTSLGGVVGALGFACVGKSKGFHSHFPLLVAFGVVVLGLLSLYWAGYTLREGIRNERWPEAEVEPLRRIVVHPAWKAAMVLLLMVMSAALLEERSHLHFFWAAFLLLQTTSQLNNAISPPQQAQRAGGHIEWTKVSPLHSEHWGER